METLWNYWKECKQWWEPNNVMWRDIHFINDTTAATAIS